MSSMGFIKALELMQKEIPVANPVDYPHCIFFLACFPVKAKCKNDTGKKVMLDYEDYNKSSDIQLCMFDTKEKILKRGFKFGGKELSQTEHWQKAVINWDICWELLKLGFVMRRLSWMKKKWEDKTISLKPVKCNFNCSTNAKYDYIRVHVYDYGFFNVNVDNRKRHYKVVSLPIKPNDPSGFYEARDWCPLRFCRYKNDMPKC